MLRQRENGIIQNTQLKGEEKQSEKQKETKTKSNEQKIAMNMVDNCINNHTKC